MSEDSVVRLPSKANAGLAITLTAADPPTSRGGSHRNVLVVFLNGLILPRASWSDAVKHLAELRREAGQATPALLCYDRFSQGDSDPDPTDPPDTPYGHGAISIVADLHELLTRVSCTQLGRDLTTLRLVLVGNSVGCALARLYAAAHPGSAVAFLFLDSMMANTDFVSLFPDPDSRAFDPDSLPADVTPAGLRHARAVFAKHFHPTVGNPERFDRRGLAGLLPHADAPPLPGTPLLVVVGHDPDTFAENCETGTLSVPRAVINGYVDPAWRRYNEGLTRLVPNAADVKIAKGCGHFIQKDGPTFVARELSELLTRIIE